MAALASAVGGRRVGVVVPPNVLPPPFGNPAGLAASGGALAGPGAAIPSFDDAALLRPR